MVKFRNTGRSRNLEDRRGASSGGGSGFGGMSGLPIPGGLAMGGTAGIIITIAIVAAFMFLGGGEGGFGAFDAGSQEVDPSQEPLVDEMSGALDHIQAFWADEMPWAESVPEYRDAKLVLFTSGVSTGCGNATSDIGPFYCPADEKAYIDLSFFQQLETQFDAPGDFAQVYVLAHELGHHVQNVVGTNQRVAELEQQNPGQANALSVRLELQADCYAGVWAHFAEEDGVLEVGDVKEGIDAAAAVGDDRLGAGAEENWTHGSSEQRVRWFTNGMESGDPEACNTFDAASL